METFFDTHAHLADPVFSDELPELLDRAAAAGIMRIVTVGTDLESSRKCVALAEQFPSVYAAVGWHPSHAMDAPDDIRPALREMAQNPRVVALGETGLDHYWLPSKKPGGTLEQDNELKARQSALFRQHLEVAVETSLGCVIHTRDSFDATIRDLEPFADRVKSVFHCFAYDVPSMQRVIELGSYVSFTGILTFKNGANIRETLAAVPQGRFMFETDCPYLAPVPYRGKRCEPAYAKETAEVAAQVRGVSLAQLSAWTCAAAEEFFRFR